MIHLWIRQKPKPEPHVLHVFRDALHDLMWPVDQLWQVGLERGFGVGTPNVKWVFRTFWTIVFTVY